MAVITVSKPFDEVEKALEGAENVLIIGCEGCSESIETGGSEQVKETINKLNKINISSKGNAIESPCKRDVVKEYLEKQDNYDTVLAMCCGAGLKGIFKTLKELNVESKAIPALNTVGIGVLPEKSVACLACGTCNIDNKTGECNAITKFDNLLKDMKKFI